MISFRRRIFTSSGTSSGKCLLAYVPGRSEYLNEVADLVAKGYKEVTLLGQNVNSYRFEKANGEVVTFPMLLRTVAESAPGVRIRFTTSHPKDMSDETLQVIAEVPNVCKHIHLPVQSGSSRRCGCRRYAKVSHRGRSPLWTAPR